MDSSDLSCNWKKLQESLRKDNPKLKRKVTHDVFEPHWNSINRGNGSFKFNRIKLQKKEFSETQLVNSESPKAEASETRPLSQNLKSSFSALAVWAEDNDISSKDLAAAYGNPNKSATPLDTGDKSEKINEGLSSAVDAGKYIAIDCEMVGVGPNPDTSSVLARISLVDYYGNQVYDSFVLPKEKVTDYRTFVSGVTPQLLRSARTLEVVQQDVAKLMDGRILVGHAIKNDLNALLLGHPRRNIRDTSKYPPFRKLARGKTPGLKKLAREILGIDIQSGEHSSIEDARAAMLLFRKEKEGFDKEHLKRWGNHSMNRAKSKAVNSKASKKKKRKKRAGNKPI